MQALSTLNAPVPARVPGSKKQALRAAVTVARIEPGPGGAGAAR